MWAMPSKTLLRDRESAPPVSNGRGRPPTRPWHRVEQWCQALDEEAGRRIDLCDGPKGLLEVDVGKRCVALRTPRRQQGAEERVGVIR